jgi:adenosine deaminase
MSVKKAELHVHLEGTISPILAERLAERNRCPIPDGLIAADGKSYYSRDFLHFLSVFDQLSSLIKSPQDYYDLTFDYLKQSAEQNVIYCEMMYSPDHAERMSGIPSKEHLDAIQNAIDDAEDVFGIVGRILITMVRHFGVDAAERVLTEAMAYRPRCVVGFGLGGDELGFPLPLFKHIFDKAHQEGFVCTAHVGEFGSFETMREAIEDFSLKRIGHGVQAIYSQDVISLLKDNQIALEICPSSNIKFGLFPSLKEHPFGALLAQGVRVSLNSDDPPFIPTTIGLEYALVQQTFQLSDTTMQNITKMAIESAFVDEQTKTRLLAELV